MYIGSAPSDTSKTRGLTEEIQDDDIRDYFNRWQMQQGYPENNSNLWKVFRIMIANHGARWPRYGTVVGVAQHRWDDSNRKKGYGYIEFSDWDGAQVARLGAQWLLRRNLGVIELFRRRWGSTTSRGRR